MQTFAFTDYLHLFYTQPVNTDYSPKNFIMSRKLTGLKMRMKRTLVRSLSIFKFNTKHGKIS